LKKSFFYPQVYGVPLASGSRVYILLCCCGSAFVNVDQ
jgi:hypothetical protein